MNLEEMQARLKKTEITQEQLQQLSPIYVLLDFHKDDFCKLVDAIGIDKWLDNINWFNRLDKAEQELSAKERYMKAWERLEALESEKAELEQIVNSYKPI